MIILGADCQTRTGIAIDDGKGFRALSFRARSKRPAHLAPAEINVEFESAVAEEFRDFFRATLVAEGVEYVACEEPRTRDYERTRTVIDTETEWAGKAIRKVKERGSNNLAMVRGLFIVGALFGVCRRLNIPVVTVPVDDWRQAFLGYSRAPKGTTDGRQYFKAAVMRQCALVGVEAPNDDAADAVGVVWWLRGYLNPMSAGRAGDLFREKASA